MPDSPIRLTPRQLDLLRDVAKAKGPGRGRLYVYAYLTVWRQEQGDTWDTARSYVTTQAQHLPGLCSDVSTTARHLVAAGLIELGESGRRRAERPYRLTEAGQALLAKLDGQEPADA
jgi:DNA-binding MarR family transcriptional regulator